MIDYQLISYQHSWILNEVYKASDKLRGRLTNTSLFESRALNKIGKYLSIEETNVKNRRYITRMVHREAADALIRKNKKEYSTNFSDIGHENDDGEYVEYEPIDVLANVESEVIGIKETITLLAKGDRRRELILNAWANGFTNDKEISHTLASVLSGNAESHRKFILRFKTECRGVLSATAI